MRDRPQLALKGGAPEGSPAGSGIPRQAAARSPLPLLPSGEGRAPGRGQGPAVPLASSKVLGRVYVIHMCVCV